MSRPGLFIDFDGTLCFDRFWRSLDPAIFAQIQDYLFTKDSRLVSDWMRGKYTSEQVNRKISIALDLDYESLWKVFVHDCKTMKVDVRALALLENFKNKYTTILFTDNMDSLDRFTIPALNLNSHFDLIVNSYNERITKNESDGAIFQKVCSKNDIDISSSILIDNSEKTCEIFTKLGGKSYLVTKEKPLSYWLGHIVN